MNAWVFDVDGVLTNLVSKKVEHPQIINEIVERLSNKEPIGLITGRTFTNVEENLLDPFESLVRNKTEMDLVNLEAEFGGANIHYSNGQRILTVEKEFSLPPDLIEKAKDIVGEYSSVASTNPKVVFYTAEVVTNGDIAEFKKKQPEIVQRLQLLVNDFGLSDSVEVHQDTVAINVKNKKLNKHLATQKFLSWLEDNKLKPDRFYVFGDSESDLQIGLELFSQGKQFKFIYTGTGEVKDYPFEVVKTVKKFEEGTLEYLTNR